MLRSRSSFDKMWWMWYRRPEWWGEVSIMICCWKINNHDGQRQENAVIANARFVSRSHSGWKLGCYRSCIANDSQRKDRATQLLKSGSWTQVRQSSFTFPVFFFFNNNEQMLPGECGTKNQQLIFFSLVRLKMFKWYSRAIFLVFFINWNLQMQTRV